MTMNLRLHHEASLKEGRVRSPKKKKKGRSQLSRAFESDTTSNSHILMSFTKSAVMRLYSAGLS